MQFKYFSIPAEDPDTAEEIQNRFLRSVKVLTVSQEFHARGDRPQ